MKELQNGSDIRGVAIAGPSGQDVNLTPEVVRKISFAFAVWLASRKSATPRRLKIAVGTDSRLSGPALKAACLEALVSAGCDAIDVGLASTPAMFMTTVEPTFLCDGAVMLTASHLPFNRNGLKFFTSEGGLEKEDISTILTLAEAADFTAAKAPGTASASDLMNVYAQILVDKIRADVANSTNYQRPLNGLKILVDAGNGAGGFFVEKVLKPLGADTSGSQFLEPDGRFPNHVPNPESKEAISSLQQAVVRERADFGIIFDTDVDRAAAVDRQGNEINRNRLIALAASIVLEEHPGSVIVTDSITSDGLTEFIQKKLGGVHHRFKRGYKNVINESLRLNKEGKNSWLAIETSGHAAMRENHFLDDGAYLIAKLLIKLARLKMEGKTIEALIAELPEPKESSEFRLNIGTEDFKGYGAKLIDELSAYAEKAPGWSVVPDNYEGVRVSCDNQTGNGWFLLRLSLHDPVIPINIESESNGGVTTIAQGLIKFLRGFDKLDLSEIDSWLNKRS